MSGHDRKGARRVRNTQGTSDCQGQGSDTSSGESHWYDDKLRCQEAQARIAAYEREVDRQSQEQLAHLIHS